MSVGFRVECYEAVILAVLSQEYHNFLYFTESSEPLSEISSRISLADTPNIYNASLRHSLLMCLLGELTATLS